MDSSLRELFGRAGPIRAIDRVPSGSPAAFVLRRLPNHPAPKTIDGTLALARRGMPMLRAKRAMEALLTRGKALVDVPTVEDPAALIGELGAAGIQASIVRPPQPVDLRGLRERLSLTREEFAATYGLEVETVRNWELGRREPDRTARSYLQAISNNPQQVEEAYAASAHPPP
jgi:putative transcriptional regulator